MPPNAMAPKATRKITPIYYTLATPLASVVARDR
jgi:hypothetical protein